MEGEALGVGWEISVPTPLGSLSDPKQEAQLAKALEGGGGKASTPDTFV